MRIALVLAVLLVWTGAVFAADAPKLPSIADQQPNTWIKRSPLPGGPPSPRLGYESSWDYDPIHKKFIRWGGHDPGGGGPQLSETWTFDPQTAVWELLVTNNNPPGNCCCRENVCDPASGLFYRFSYPAFGHGWYWDRARFLSEDSVWTFDLGANRWRNMRPGREPALNVGKPAFHDPNSGVIWVYDTKLRAYDPFTNTWFSVNPSPDIKKRTYAGMALDPVRNKIVLIGDHYQSDSRTWVYDIAADKWTDMKPATSPPAGRTCPTLVHDPLNDKMILITLSDKWDTQDAAKRTMETWTYDLPTNTWTKMNPPQEPDYSGTRARLMTYIPDLNIVVLENRTDKEQQVWTYRLAGGKVPEKAVAAPAGLAVTSVQPGNATDFITLAWQPVPNASGYKVYRADVGPDAPWKVAWRLVTDKPVAEPRFQTGVQQFAKTVARFRVTALNADGAESAPSQSAVMQPPLVLESRVDVLAKDKVVFSWTPPPDRDALGYVVERAVLRPISASQKIGTAAEYKSDVPMTAMVEKAALGPFERVTPQPIRETSFVDTVDLGQKADLKSVYWQPYFGGGDGPEGDKKTYDMTKAGCPFTIYAYRVRAVNRLGVEGGPSPYQMTVPNPVENLRAKEDGKSVQLRWDSSLHKDIQGYLVYRLDDRFAPPATVSLLTPKPITETEFADTAAAGKTRRYYVVVVDALGQQGLPSGGVWGFREYRAHYAPWMPKDGWHQ